MKQYLLSPPLQNTALRCHSTSTPTFKIMLQTTVELHTVCSRAWSGWWELGGGSHTPQGTKEGTPPRTNLWSAALNKLAYAANNLERIDPLKICEVALIIYI